MKKKKMTLQEFQLLPEIGLVYIKGIFLDFQLEPKTRYTLYALNMFFVEIEFDLEIKKTVGKKEFVYGDILEKYLNRK